MKIMWMELKYSPNDQVKGALERTIESRGFYTGALKPYFTVKDQL